MPKDRKKEAIGLMVDLEIAIGKTLPWWLNRKHIKDVMVKVSEIIKPAMERDDYLIRQQAREIMCDEDRIDELSNRVDELEAEEVDQEEEAEHQALVKMFYDNTNRRKETA